MLCKVIILAGLSYLSPSKPDGDDPIDTLNIEGVVVNSKLRRYSSSLSLKIIPTIELRSNKQLLLSDMLSSLSNVVVSSYGPGGISTASLRGLGSYHTAILWNGINLQSPMNGGVNLSNIPISFIDQVAIQQGGNGALFGSGAIGGVIHLDNSLELGKGYTAEIYQTYGSFNSIFSGVNSSFSGTKFATSTKLFYSEADNDFRFHNISKIGSPYENQVNANSSKIGLMQNFVFQATNNNKLSSSVWLQNSFNRYPPMMTSYTNKEKEHTDFIRGVVQWQSSHEMVDFNVTGSYFNDRQKYRNPGTGEASNHTSNTGNFESEAIIKFADEQRIETGINVCYEQVTSTNYSTNKDRYRPAASVTYKYSDLEGTYDFFAGLREEMVETEANPITWSIGSRVNFLNRFNLRGNISRNYRIPAMNDLFWLNGWGNPNLKPEQGYGEELGIDYLQIKETSSFVTKLSVFSNNVNNWIIWLPSGSVWSPQNYKKVWARGIDLSASYTHNLKDWSLSVDAMGTRTISTNEKSATEQEEGKQLPYIPRIKASGSLSVQYKTFRIKYSHSYTGKRYTSADNTKQIDPFSLATISLEKSFEQSLYTIKTFIRIDNIWNEEYQIMSYYPMPLRSYQIGVSIQFNKPIH